MGCDFLCKEVCKDDSVTVKLLRQNGAIIIVRGNVPQFAFGYHTDNKIWGTAQNPYDPRRSCGGSSGGDAGLVSSRCIPFSIGSDIGGSIRVPAHFCGIRGFKPTAWRVSGQGHRDG